MPGGPNLDSETFGMPESPETKRAEIEARLRAYENFLQGNEGGVHPTERNRKRDEFIDYIMSLQN